MIDGDIGLFGEGLVEKMDGAITSGDGFFILNTEGEGEGFLALDTEDGSVKFSSVVNGEGEMGKVSVFSVTFTSVLFV